MSRVTLALVLALVGCKDRKKEAAKDDWKPPGETPSWEKPGAKDAAPPASSTLRIALYDLDVAAPPGARIDGGLRGANLEGGPCRVSFGADSPVRSLEQAIASVQVRNQYETFREVTRQEATADGFVLAYTVHSNVGDRDTKRIWVRRKVAAMRVDCRGEDVDPACVVSTCAGLTAVPGGVAEQPFEVSGDPVVETSSGGGIDGGTRSLVRVWRDGTVQLAGWGCAQARGVIGAIDPARVEAMLARIDQVGFRKLDEGDLAMECCDCVGQQLTVNTDGTPIARGETVCGGAGNEVLAEAIAAVHEAAGSNPCSR